MNNNLIFRARALLAQHEKLKELNVAIAKKMCDDIGKGIVQISWRNYPEQQLIEEAEGILDRMRRDLVHMLAKEPTILVQLCEQILNSAPAAVSYIGFPPDPGPRNEDPRPDPGVKKPRHVSISCSALKNAHALLVTSGPSVTGHIFVEGQDGVYFD